MVMNKIINMDFLLLIYNYLEQMELFKIFLDFIVTITFLRILFLLKFLLFINSYYLNIYH